MRQGFYKMTYAATFKTPKKTLEQFVEMLRETGGHYKHNPQHIGRSAFIECGFENEVQYIRFCERWRQANKNWFSKLLENFAL